MLDPGGGMVKICDILRYDHGPCDRVGERGATLMGLATGPSFVAAKCLDNLHNAICYRHGKAQPPGRPMPAAINWYRHFLPEFAIEYYLQLWYWFDAWLLKWSFAKRQRILESLFSDFPRPSEVKAFVKREGGHKLIKKARAIQMYVNMHTQATIGAQVTAAQKAFAKVFDGTQVHEGLDVCFASGMNGQDLGAWMQRNIDMGYTNFYERDGANWDACMNAYHLCLKRLFYDIDPQLSNTIQQGFEVEGRAKGRDGRILKYRLHGTTKSGHNDTSLGNSIVNAGIAIEALKACGVRGRIIVVGDDLLIASPDKLDGSSLAAVEAACGIVPEYRVFTDPAHVSFVSGMWFPVRGGWGFGPKIGRLLKRLMWTTNVVSPKQIPAWKNSVVCGLYPVCQALPIARAWLERNWGERGYVNSNVLKKRDDIYSTSFEFDPTSIDYVARRYKLDPATIVQIESMIHALPEGQHLVAHPLLEHISAVDNAEICDRDW